MILIYEQQTHIDYNEPKLPVNTKGRYSHKIKSFAAKFNLGSPVAGACFQAEWDDYVAKLYAKFPEEKWPLMLQSTKTACQTFPVFSAFVSEKLHICSLIVSNMFPAPWSCDNYTAFL